MKIMEKEKNILQSFIDCKIPLAIKDNLYEYKCDLMECYEELFNTSHSLIDGYRISVNDVFCILDKDFTDLLYKVGVNDDLKDFCEQAILVLEIIKNNLT
ncbi:MAG: hypothetical protein C4537_00355 [Acholeplasma sp.]|jgi:hypothetical protein|nr:MAG: hypothetical protein C4537_00355 [Acholeplasma sp.]